MIGEYLSYLESYIGFVRMINLFEHVPVDLKFETINDLMS